MANVALSAKVQLFGTLPGGEIFATGFGITQLTIAAAGGAAQDIADLVAVSANGHSAWYRALNVANATLDGVRVYTYIDSTGGASNQGEATLPSITGTASSQHPDQCCFVYTLRTGAPGRSRRGRMYVPATGPSLTAGGLVVGSAVTTFVGGMVAFLDDVNAGLPSIASEARVAVLSGTTLNGFPVSSVDADGRLDIQRRRANQQDTGSRSSGDLA